MWGRCGCRATSPRRLVNCTATAFGYRGARSSSRLLILLTTLLWFHHLSHILHTRTQNPKKQTIAYIKNRESQNSQNNPPYTNHPKNPAQIEKIQTFTVEHKFKQDPDLRIYYQIKTFNPPTLPPKKSKKKNPTINMKRSTKTYSKSLKINLFLNPKNIVNT